MALDASIFAPYLRRPRSVAEFDQMAMAEEDQRARREANQLAMLVQREGLDEQRRQRDMQNRLMAELGQMPQATPDDVAGVYRRYGRIKEAGDILKDAATLAKEKALTQQADEGTRKTQQERSQQAYRFLITGLAQANNPQAAKAYLTQGAPVLAGVIGMQAAQAAIQGVPDDPAAFEQWRRGMYATGVKEPEKLLPTFAMRDFGGFVQPGGLDPVSGRLTMVGQPVAKTMTPDAAAADARARERLKFDQEQAAQGVTYQQDAEGNFVALPTKAAPGTIVRAVPVAAPGAGIQPLKGKAGTEKIDKAVEQFSTKLQKDGIPELETAIAGAEGAINRYPKGEVPGVGRVSGAVPAALLSGEGNDVRQAVAAVRNIVLNARSGAAVTDQELRRLVEELGTGLGQSEDALRRGLARVRERMEAIKANLAAGVTDDVLSEYERRGGMKITRGGAKPAGKPAAAPKFLGFE